MFTPYQNIDPILNSPNKWDGRNGNIVKAIVIHKPEGELPGVINYLMEPATQKSYHFVISYLGQVTRLVSTDDSAWHCGGPEGATWTGLIPDVNPNYYTIGVSLEGFAAQPHTEAQFQSLYKLVADLCLQYGIAPTADTIVYHHEIYAPKTCPGVILNKEAIITCAQALVAAGNVVGWPPATAAAPTA